MVFGVGEAETVGINGGTTCCALEMEVKEGRVTPHNSALEQDSPTKRHREGKNLVWEQADVSSVYIE